MRMSICAQSWASVPPAPALISTCASRKSSGPRSKRPQLEGVDLGLDRAELLIDVGRHRLIRLAGQQSRPFQAPAIRPDELS
jgi:hypothetical protein